MTDHTGVAAAAVAPPVARKMPTVDSVHCERRQGDYFWLREKDHAEVLAYLRAENVYTDAVMQPTEAFQAALDDAMLARIKENDQIVPYRRREHFYYSRTETGKQSRSSAGRRGA